MNILTKRTGERSTFAQILHVGVFRGAHSVIFRQQNTQNTELQLTVSQTCQGRSDVVFFVVPSSTDTAWGGVRHPRCLVLVFGRTAAAQHGPSNQAQGG